MGEVTKADLDALTTSLTAAFTAALNTVNDSMNNQIGETRGLLGGRNNNNNRNRGREGEEIVQPEQQGQSYQDYKVKAEIHFFSGNLGVEDYLDWQLQVDRFFEIMEVPKNKQVKHVAWRLKSTAAVWWDKLQNTWKKQRKQGVKTWRRMKQLMTERFLPDDYEQILYRLYIECVQGTRTVAEYTGKFLRYLERNELGETEEATSLTLKAEQLEKPSRASSFQRYTYQKSTELGNSSAGKAKAIQQNTKSSHRASNQPFKGASSSSSSSGAQNRVPHQKPNNPYARPTTELCYRCNKLGHRSNVCPERRQYALIDDYDEDDEEVGRCDEYEGVEFAVEESPEKINIVLQRILLSPNEDGQRHNIFRSLCSINNKVCNLIVDNGSCKNFVARKLVEYLQLPTQLHETPYSLGWVKKGPQVRVAKSCKVPVSIDNYSYGQN
ncbi:uncharacterized protein LOC121051782 [Rosa chinensis]|uniref:uncharacterized protein LOC121051782 n=1 Tax=Rosa chinensis TaxID=74649 RepID=UPI001AD8F5B3|nr:uncharacterized protein LOC121051782 [Rosa chinensis]